VKLNIYRISYPPVHPDTFIEIKYIYLTPVLHTYTSRPYVSHVVNPITTTISRKCICLLRRYTLACCALRYHLLEDYGLLDATGSRHKTQPAHAGVGGHHTTVSPLFFIAYPQTRVPAPSMLGPCADAAGARSSIHYPTAHF